jgi:hypothetical protein
VEARDSHTSGHSSWVADMAVDNIIVLKNGKDSIPWGHSPPGIVIWAIYDIRWIISPYSCERHRKSCLPFYITVVSLNP